MNVCFWGDERKREKHSSLDVRVVLILDLGLPQRHTPLQHPIIGIYFSHTTYNIKRFWKSAYMVDFISSGIRLGQMCDLSRDVVAGLPVISMLGDCEVFIENYRGILEYSSEYLKVSTKIGNIRVSGSNLVIYHMNQDEILLRGRIGKVSLKGEADEKDT